MTKSAENVFAMENIKWIFTPISGHFNLGSCEKVTWTVHLSGEQHPGKKNYEFNEFNIQLDGHPICRVKVIPWYCIAHPYSARF